MRFTTPYYKLSDFLSVLYKARLYDYNYPDLIEVDLFLHEFKND